jgi:AraC-like DNA-binding protein
MLLYYKKGAISLEIGISTFNQRQIMLTQNLEIYHYRQPYFKSIDFHNHDFYEIYFFLDGSVTYYIEENVYELIPGDILIIPPGKMHRPVISNTDSIYERIVLWINIGFINSLGNNDCSLITTLNEMAEKNHLIHFEKDDFNTIINYLNMLILNNSIKDYGHNLLLESYASILLVMINKQFLHSNIKYNSQIDKEIIPTIITYINENIDKKLDLDMLSCEFFVSKYHLIRKFKKYTHSTVYDYIISKRIIYAKKLMREGINATDACRISGFTDYSNFYKSFLSKAYITPKQYKIMCSQNL